MGMREELLVPIRLLGPLHPRRLPVSSSVVGGCGRKDWRVVGPEKSRTLVAAAEHFSGNGYM